MKSARRALLNFSGSFWMKFLRLVHARPFITFSALVAIVLAVASLVFSTVETDTAHPVWRTVVYMMSGIDVEPPDTALGEVTATLVLLSGVILVSLLTGFVASEFSRLLSTATSIARKPSHRTFQEHIIIFGWSAKTKAILRELDATFSAQGYGAPDIIVVSDHESLERGPESIYEHVSHVPGVSTDPDVLRRADLMSTSNGTGARVAVVLSDSSLTGDEADRRSLLTLLAIESLHPPVISLVDVSSSEWAAHFENANADEVLVPSEYASTLLARAAEFPGTSSYIDELLALAPLPGSSGLHEKPAPISFYVKTAAELRVSGMSIAEAVLAFHARENVIIAGYLAENGVQLFPEISGETTPLSDNDKLVVIATPEQIDV